jgi:pimeloyl-ACP methyl ester carboxylesterase
VLAGASVPAFEGLRQGFDVVSFDVRGSHRSRPVQCEVELLGGSPSGNDEALVAFFDDFGRRFAETCLAQAGPFIRSMSFNTIARDMDVLRRALGERQISYAGLSFGTTLGAVYASLFPRHVRAMLLDSGVMPQFRDSLVEFAAEQALSFELTLHRLDELCRNDSACRLREGGVVGAVDELVTRLDGTMLDGDQLKRILTSLLQFDANWPLLVRAVADGREENYRLLFQLVPFISNVPLSNTPFFAIKCNSFGTRRSAAEYLPMSRAVGAVTPRTSDDLHVAAIVSSCTAWPPADLPIIRNVGQQLEHPLLFFGTDFDPNTPLSWTRSLAFALGAEASLVRYQGGGHTIITRGTSCVGGIVTNYLFNLVVPAEGTTCPARPLTFGPSAQLSTMREFDASWASPWQSTEAQRP